LVGAVESILYLGVLAFLIIGCDHVCLPLIWLPQFSMLGSFLFIFLVKVCLAHLSKDN